MLGDDGTCSNADLVVAYNILIKGIRTIALSPRKGIGVMGWRLSAGLNPHGDVVLNLPALATPRTTMKPQQPTI